VNSSRNKLARPNKLTPGVVVFAYHNMGVMALRTLLDSNVSIHIVITHKDNPLENIWFKSVAGLCKEKAVPFVYSENYSTEDLFKLIRQYSVSVIFSFYFRELIPESILSQATLGGVNLHGSMLPKYRGRSPVNWQLINGETSSGATLHYMIEQPDAGDIIDQVEITIGSDDTPLVLFSKLESSGKTLLQRSLPSILNGTCHATPQKETESSYFGGRRPEDGKINWFWSAKKLHDLIRGVTRPYPGAFSFLGSKKVFIWQSNIQNVPKHDQGLAPGSIHLHQGRLFVMTSDQYVEIKQWQVGEAGNCSDTNSTEFFVSTKSFRNI